MVGIPDMQLERLKLAFNVFETTDIAVFHSYDFGLQGFQLDEAVKQDFVSQLVTEGIIYRSIELTKDAIILRR
jgi:hypothetical protein